MRVCNRVLVVVVPQRTRHVRMRMVLKGSHTAVRMRKQRVTRGRRWLTMARRA